PVGYAGGYFGTIPVGGGDLSWAPLGTATTFPSYRAQMIRPVAETGDGGSQLVSVTPTSGSIAPGNSDEITVNVDASGVSAGTYNYELVITSNDPVNPTLTVDVTVTVGEGGSEGELTFSPSPLVAQLASGESGTETVTLTNT